MQDRRPPHDCYSEDVASGLRYAMDPFEGLGMAVSADVWWCDEWVLEVVVRVGRCNVLWCKIGAMDGAGSVTSDLLNQHRERLADLYAAQIGPAIRQNPFLPAAPLSHYPPLALITPHG